MDHVDPREFAGGDKRICRFAIVGPYKIKVDMVPVATTRPKAGYVMRPNAEHMTWPKAEFVTRPKADFVTLANTGEANEYRRSSRIPKKLTNTREAHKCKRSS